MSKPLFDWRWHIASADGPRNPTTRLVLLTISLHMSVLGESAWPTQATLSTETGLSVTTVKAHIALAVKLGWLERTESKATGKGWRRTNYTPSIPGDVGRELTHDRAQRGSPDEQRGSPDVNHTFSINSTGNSCTPPQFDSAWAAWRAAPGRLLTTRAKTLAAWNRAKASLDCDDDSLLSRVRRFLAARDDPQYIPDMAVALAGPRRGCQLTDDALGSLEAVARAKPTSHDPNDPWASVWDS